ncbi:MAG: DUF342 domain-containing protein [Campylobacterales bacterium]|nr:DUF342 domain-containing protein [Campylobacterales bacterium]
MGFFSSLFGIEHENQEESSEKIEKVEEKELFEPFEVEVENLKEAMENISKVKQIDISEIDFEIIDVKTFVKSQNIFSEANSATLKKIKSDKEFLRDKTIEIKQSYRLKFFSKKDSVPFELKYQIASNKAFTKVYAIISKESIFYEKNIEKLQQALFCEINKKKLRLNMLLNIYCEDLISKFKELSSEIVVHDGLRNDVKIAICESVEPIFPIHPTLNYCFKSNNDVKSSNMLIGVKEHEVLIEYIKPKNGKNGRDCRGKIIAVLDVETVEPPLVKTDDTIIMKEDEHSMKYIAQKSGYLDFKNQIYSIGDNLEVQTISRKTTGSIKTTDEHDVHISVKNSDAMSEAIESGVKVEAVEVNIDGNIADNVEIKAKSVRIGGQTHQSSKIFADNAVIKNHKGYLKAKDAEITVLEGGIVEAQRIYIKDVVGGEIRGNVVRIDTLKSNSEITVYESITIEHQKGEDNIITIDLRDNQIEIVEDEFTTLQKEYKLKKATFEKYQKLYMQLVKQIKDIKKANEEVPPILIKKYQSFKSLQKELDEIEKKLNQLKIKEEAQSVIQEEQQSNMIDKVKIVCKSGWSGYNTVKFLLLKPEIELTYNPKPLDKTIMLQENEDGEIDIVTTSKF